MAAAPSLMTVDDYFRTPETLAPAELDHGFLRVADAPSPRHQSAVAHLFRALDRHVREHDLGAVWLAPLDVVLDERRALVVQPDLLFISHEREGIVRDRIRGAPDLVIEVLSPSARVGRTDAHLTWFAESGVKECWLVHLDRRDVTVIRFAGGRIAERRVFDAGEPVASSILANFALSLDQIL